jgi:hypothetical protein
MRAILLVAGKSMPDEALLRGTVDSLQGVTRAEFVMVARCSG